MLTLIRRKTGWFQKVKGCLKHHFDIDTNTPHSASSGLSGDISPPSQPHTCTQGPHPLKDNTTDKQLAPHYHQTAACRLVKLRFLSSEAGICCCLLLSSDPGLLPPSTNCCLLIQGNEARRGEAGTRSAERRRVVSICGWTRLLFLSLQNTVNESTVGHAGNLFYVHACALAPLNASFMC